MSLRPRAGLLVAALAAALLAALVCPQPSGAHAVLVKSTPPSRATLRERPDRVELWFNERLEPAFSTLSVWNQAGAQVDRRDSAVGPEDPRRLSVTVAPLEPGSYTVRYRVLSVDGHIVDSTFSFAISPGAPAR